MIVNKTFSITYEDGDRHSVTASYYEPETNAFYSSPIYKDSNYDSESYFYVEPDEEFVIDFENNVIYMGSEQLQLYIENGSKGGTVPIDTKRLTNVFFD